jgi:ribosomal protein S27AE
MVDQWYFARDGQTSGPFSAVRLQELAAAGTIRPADGVWKDGMTTRVAASRVAKLFAAPAVPVPPAGPAAPSRPPSLQPAALVVAARPPPGPTPAEPSTMTEWLASGEDVELADGEKVWEAAAPPEPAEPPEEEPPAAEKPRPPQPEAKPLRVLGVKGGVISSQDGKLVKFRKTCLRCSHADSSITTMQIRRGVTRVNYFCPKCRKGQQTEVTCIG